MSYPNSIANPPSPQWQMPRPANDNIRTPRINVRPQMPRPANDNFPAPPRGQIRFGPGLRLIPWFYVGYTAVDLWLRYAQPSGWVHPAGYVQNGYCAANQPPTHVGPYRNPLFCSTALGAPIVHPPSMNLGYCLVRYVGTHANEGWHRIRVSERWVREDNAPVGDPPYYQEASTRVSPYTVARSAPMHFPMIYPPLLNPGAFAPPPLKYGYGGERQIAILPEDSESGYGRAEPRVQTDHLLSERPPRRTRERKMRVNSYAVGRLIQRIVGGSTEGLDYAWAIFNSLPRYLRYKAFNHYRRLEVRPGRFGFSSEARLRYVALTPGQMLQWAYDNIDAINPFEFAKNITLMLAGDVAWAAVGRAMGQYARGPWDQPRDDPQEEPDWEPFIEYVTEGIEHNEQILDNVAAQYGLTREELKRINRLFQQQRERNPGYEPRITV